ncbi:MAG TPA: ATP-binding protein [Streptosporangiaceae bacterium]|nr:ATP-binding protein [Streptosporangiaceae bacterium]
MKPVPVLGDDLAGPWFRVQSIVARQGAGAAEHDFLDILPAASAAARARRPFMAGWLCRAAGAPLEFITNAALPEPELEPGNGCALLFPPGARGRPAGDWLTACEALAWAPCPGRQALPLVSQPEPVSDQEPRQPGRFESALAVARGRPFGWLVVAEPTGLLGAEEARLRTQVTVLRQHDEELLRSGTEKATRRLAELDAFREAGLWAVRVLVGAATPEELARLAPVLAGSAGLGHHPYRLGTTLEPQPLAAALTAKAVDRETEAEVPFLATAGVLAALAGLPQAEVPGLRVLGASQFDVTSETGTGAHGPSTSTPVSLGVILDAQDRPAGEFLLPLPTLNRHALVTGATGAGKSQTVRHLLAELTRAGLPWLVIEPVKAEYPGMAGRLAGLGPAGAVTVLNPADPGAIPVSVNPLAPERGYPVQAHIDMVRALFLAAFDAEEPFPQIIAQALQRVYEANGWDVVTGGPLPGAAAGPAVPTLAQLQRAALAVIGEVGYGRELQADVRGFVDVRLRSLRIGSAGRFFEGGHPADVAGLLRRNVVLCLEDVANDEDKAFLMGTLIIRVVEHLRLAARAGRPSGLRHVIVIEEAHRLLRAGREGRASAHAVELFAAMLAEIRAYGEGLVIAEQIPSKLVSDVVKNTALKVMHRLPAADDRHLAGAAMNLGEAQSRHVVSLEPGAAAVFADGMDRPIKVRVPFGGDAEGTRPGPVPPLLARRSTACGPRCAGERPCTQREMRTAGLLAAPGSPADAWLRVWVQALVLAFLTNRWLPTVPAPLRTRWDELGARLRECLLATVIDQAVTVRAHALRPSYDPEYLAASLAQAAVRAFGEGAGPGTRPGPDWVIPQVRWLHEADRLCPPGGGPPAPGQCAPPLDYGLPGLADWPGARVGHRLRALRRHPLSMDLAENRLAAWTALLGEDDQRGFGRDLATLGVGLPPASQLSHAAAPMGVTAWLPAVLSWPVRLVAPRNQPGAREAFSR